MKIDIKTSGFPLTEALKQHAERRLHFALSWGDELIVTWDLNNRVATVHDALGRERSTRR